MQLTAAQIVTLTCAIAAKAGHRRVTAADVRAADAAAQWIEANL